MKKNKLTFIKVFILLFVFVYGYSHLSSSHIEKQINNQFNKTELVMYTFNEAKTYLTNLNYHIEENNQPEYDVFVLVATKGEEYIKVHDEGQVWVKYIFESESPINNLLINEIYYGDTYNVVKKKLGINFFNSIFQSAIGIFNPGIFAEQGDYIIIDCKNNYGYTYSLNFENNKLYQVVIQNFNVYD